MGTIYLLHFSEPFGHAKHYLGYTKLVSLETRLSQHGTSEGANLMWFVRKAGITWVLARTWEGDRTREAALKRQGGHSRKCPLCRPRIETILRHRGTLPYGSENPKQ